uniref:Uncharacterized protein n=1 Tax=Anguilla anguilla TaxID=7936 RepID=A0A0E9VMJ0_ANGAN
MRTQHVLSTCRDGAAQSERRNIYLRIYLSRVWPVHAQWHSGEEIWGSVLKPETQQRAQGLPDSTG